MKTIKIDRENNILTLSLNRPDKRNAFNQEMIAELTQAFREAASDPDIRLMLIQGEGKSFCAGADLQWMKSMVDFSLAENKADSEKLYEMYRAQELLPFPVVGHVHGHVMGGALGIVALCDVVAAERDTRFCFSEVKLGLAPAVVSEFVMKKIHRSDLHRWFLTAEIFAADEAKKMGLVHYLGRQEETSDYVVSVVEKLASNGPQALRATKQLLQKMYDNKTELKDFTVDLIAKLRVGDEGQEGLKAFFAKATPSWKS